MLKVTHDGTRPGDVQELCCMCRTPTRWWHSSDVALCPPCAKITKRAELPTKADWCAKEDAIEKARIAPAPASLTWERARHSLAMLMLGFQSNPNPRLESAYAALDAATEPGTLLAPLRKLEKS